ncbi:tight junction-associated protein 1 isoform X9 [Phyllopteryx taeniolatus]|uniref:tight junction-associated protein 1 isoform X9 n=1 Tax=Phyllopteryx taeniolatus TaxID=161469 RepID=UPI002AD41F44|nr:tight junction-associated protein 1 isoform X9 [Phyllopteryx taeniolatus]
MEQLVQRGAAAPPRSILKKGASRGEERAYDVFRKSGSAELLDGCTGRGAHFLATSTFEREPPPHQQVSSSLPSAHRKHLAWRTMHFLEEKVRFSNFLDEITCRVINPPHLMPIVRGPSRCHGSPTPRPRDRHPRKRTSDGESADRKRRWDRWVAALRRSEGAGYREEVLKVNRGDERGLPLTEQEVVSHIKEVLSDSDRIRILQQQNEDLRRRLSLSSHKMDAMEVEFDGNRHYMEAELSRTRDDLDKMRDKFRRLQNSYTASQRANQDLEEKLHALAAVSQTWVHALRTVERDKKTMDQEMVELTNKLLEAKNTIDRLEELNERYRLDCNLAVQLLKCNKSHFRNHKFADAPSMGASSASSSEDLLANWQRLFVDKMAPSVAGGGAPSRVAYSDGEEGSTPSHASSVDTDTDAEPRPDARGERLLMNSDPDRDGATVVMVTAHTCEEEEEEDEEEEEEPGSLARDLPVISPSLLDYDSAFAAAALPRPHRSPKRMGVHHLHRHQQ